MIRKGKENLACLQEGLWSFLVLTFWIYQIRLKRINMIHLGDIQLYSVMFRLQQHRSIRRKWIIF